MSEAEQEVLQQENEIAYQISPKILQTFAKLINVQTPEEMVYKTQATAGIGENSFGLILKVKITPIPTTNSKAALNCVLKIAPKNLARRSLMRVADFYRREVFMYSQIFTAYRELVQNELKDVTTAKNFVDILPNMLAFSLDDCDEFIIFEDLTAKDFKANFRTQLPTLNMVETAMQAIAKFHALSFALQYKRPIQFQTLTKQLQPDNLFSDDVKPISIEFAKSYLQRARNMLKAEPLPTEQSAKQFFELQLQALSNVEAQFKKISIRCVDSACAPHAVICHGDFWNNNLMNKFAHKTDHIIATKLVDFQMSRYSSPILDLVHYIFVCTERVLRETHFQYFIHECYYETLAKQLKFLKLNIDEIYPRSILETQLKSHGVYGLCMAALSLPFFVADHTNLLDMDEVSQAIQNVENDSNRDKDINEIEGNSELENHRKIISEFDLLTTKTAPIFKRRMIDIVADLIKYNISTKF